MAAALCYGSGTWMRAGVTVLCLPRAHQHTTVGKGTGRRRVCGGAWGVTNTQRIFGFKGCSASVLQGVDLAIDRK